MSAKLGFEPLSENQGRSLENMLKLLGRHPATVGEIPKEEARHYRLVCALASTAQNVAPPY